MCDHGSGGAPFFDSVEVENLAGLPEFSAIQCLLTLELERLFGRRRARGG